jgi:hypothetical protein
MADRRRQPGWAVAILTILLVGCAGGPTIVDPPAGSVPPTSLPSPATVDEPSSLPAATTQPTPVVTPGPSEPPVGSLARSRSVEREGVRVTVRVSQNPLRAGERAVVSTTIKNTGRDTLRWSVDGCGVNAYVHADLPGAQRRPSSISTTPLLRAYSAWLQKEARLELPIWLKFEPAWLFDERDYGCADLAIGRSLKPGASTTQELIWGGQIANRLGPPPTSPAVVSATFDYWYRGALDQGEETREPIVVTLDSWVTGGPAAAFLSPAEAIDSALADPAFADWIITQPFNDRRDGVVEYVPEVNVWMIGMIHDRDNQRSLLHAALVDPLAGKVIAIREHEVR